MAAKNHSLFTEKQLTVCRSLLKRIRVTKPTIIATGAKLLIAKSCPIISPARKEKFEKLMMVDYYTKHTRAQSFEIPFLHIAKLCMHNVAITGPMESEFTISKAVSLHLKRKKEKKLNTVAFQILSKESGLNC